MSSEPMNSSFLFSWNGIQYTISMQHNFSTLLTVGRHSDIYSTCYPSRLVVRFWETLGTLHFTIEKNLLTGGESQPNRELEEQLQLIVQVHSLRHAVPVPEPITVTCSQIVLTVNDERGTSADLSACNYAVDDSKIPNVIGFAQIDAAFTVLLAIPLPASAIFAASDVDINFEKNSCYLDQPNCRNHLLQPTQLSRSRPDVHSSHGWQLVASSASAG